MRVDLMEARCKGRQRDHRRNPKEDERTSPGWIRCFRQGSGKKETLEGKKRCRRVRGRLGRRRTEGISNPKARKKPPHRGEEANRHPRLEPPWGRSPERFGGEKRRELGFKMQRRSLEKIEAKGDHLILFPSCRKKLKSTV